MKTLLSLLFILTVGFGFAQPWKFVGSSLGINNASEVDIEIAPNGDLFMAYIDTDNSNKITVKKWLNQAWTIVGTVAIGSSGANDLQLVIGGDNLPAVGSRYPYVSGSTTYNFLQVYKFNGTAWVNQSFGGYPDTDATVPYSLAANSTGGLFITYFNTNVQNITNVPAGLITLNLSTYLALGNTNVDAGNNIYSVGTLAEVGTDVKVIINEDEGMGDQSRLLKYVPSISNVSFGGGNRETLNKLVKGLNSTSLFTCGRNQLVSPTVTNPLILTAFPSGGPLQYTISGSGTSVDMDFDVEANTCYVFYKTTSNVFFKRVSNLLTTPSETTITSGTSLCPTSVTSLAAETRYGVHVIAYISGGKCYVKEYDQPANIEDYDLFQYCEGTYFNNGGDLALYNLDPNYSSANISMTCVSQNTAIIPQSNVSISGNGLNYYLTITNTNDVATVTTVDLLWTLFENGTAVGTQLTPVTLFPKPTISFNVSTNEICENQVPISLPGKASPAGGTWSGTGVLNNFFHPDVFNPTPSLTTYIVYGKTSNQGCFAKDSFLLTINQAPDLVVSHTNAACNQTNGTASVSISGGTPSYSTYWSSGSNQTSISNVGPGQYFVTVTDNNGCSSVGVASVASSGITLSNVTTNVNCNGAATGAIDVSVSGSNPPYTYSWTNGATTQDVSNLAAGPYEVVVTDNSGCISTASYTVYEPAPLTLSSTSLTQSACASATGAVTLSYSGGNQPYSYAWTNAGGNTIGTNSPTLSNIAAGYYYNTITDALGCSHQELILMDNANGPAIAIDTIISSDCSNNGSIQITDVSSNVQTYQWSNSTSSQDLINVGPGTYVVGATGANGCYTLLSGTVQATEPMSVDVCLVTVDTFTNTNLVVWEKPITNGIDHFNIYRETSQAGLYQLVGTNLYTDESVYTDLVASPSVRSWRYKISSVDACGTESSLSANHKTIHLIINQGLGTDINLSWDSYEGFVYPNFTIYRHTDLDNWIQLTQMPINLFSYTDNPPTTDGLIYIVTVDPPSICSATKAQDFNTVRSNKENRLSTNAGTSSLEERIDAATQVYPVPSSSEITIENTSSYSLSGELFDAAGRSISSFGIESGVQNFSVAHLSNGIYTLWISYDGSKVAKRIVVQH